MANQFLVVTVLLVICEVVFSSAIPPPDVKSRVLEKPLSEEFHFDDDDRHNSDYDHEAFLGKDDVKDFDQMTSEESRKQLGIIYDKIDKDGDERVTEKELAEWIKYVQTRYVRVDTDRQWTEHNPDNNSTLSWQSYKHRIYGFLEESGDDIDENAIKSSVDENGRYDNRHMLKRDRRRWTRADLDGDGELTKQEFSAFIHPEETEHMKDLFIDETVEDIDKNGDGKISLDEYIGDMWPNGNNEDMEPDWVKTEREQFSKYRDLNQDGFMDHDEVQQWISPAGYDHSTAEAKHLVYESDIDKDSTLTKEEMLNRYDLFVSSQATDFGEALRKHDEF